MTLYRDLIKSFLVQKDNSIVDYHAMLNDCITENIDDWLKGVIRSLFYKPNNKLLVICGEQGSGKSLFVRNLFPHMFKHFFYEKGEITNEMLYNYLVADLDFDNKKKFLLILNHNFRVFSTEQGSIDTDKRLVSFCSTCQEWNYPQKKNIIITKVTDIDTFLKIDKLTLWKQIYTKFKPTDYVSSSI